MGSLAVRFKDWGAGVLKTAGCNYVYMYTHTLIYGCICNTENVGSENH